MTSTELPDRGLVFWPVGTGDSTTVVIDSEHVVQVDLHDMAMADEEDADVAAVVDRLVDVLPRRDGMPYLAAFILTHADMDHCLGFADLLNEVTIGELWATPRLWREYTDHDLPLCDDAEAFHKEAKRRVAATKEAVADGQTPASGDRIRVVGYDTDHEKHAYSELPAEYLSYPGEAVTTIDGDDLSDRFEAFIHAPFKDDCAAERNDTSLALQITLKDDDGRRARSAARGPRLRDDQEDLRVQRGSRAAGAACLGGAARPAPLLEEGHVRHRGRQGGSQARRPRPARGACV